MNLNIKFSTDNSTNENKTQRIDKYLANLGICSRRNIKKLLKENIVTVNKRRVKTSGTRIIPEKDEIRVNGKKIRKPQCVYYKLNKPKGAISTTSDEFKRKNVVSFIPSTERIYPIGRLDKDTTGLIILTNDGNLTYLLTHPKNHVYKTYHLTIKGKPTKEQIELFKKGIILKDGITAPAKIKIIKESINISHLSVSIYEGKNRQIRRMCEAVGIKLLELKRIAIGPINLGSIKEGEYKYLTEKEIRALKEAVISNKKS